MKPRRPALPILAAAIRLILGEVEEPVAARTAEQRVTRAVVPNGRLGALPGPNPRQSITFSRYFLQPANVTHRRYEALRAYFVEGLPSAEAARRFGYTPGSFRVLTHHFRQDPRREFFLPSAREARPHGKQNRLRDQVVGLRKQNFSVSTSAPFPSTGKTP